MASSLEILRADRKVMKNTYDNPLTSQSLKNRLKTGLDKIEKLISEQEKEEAEKRGSIDKMVRDSLTLIKTKTEKRQFLEYLINALKKEYKGLVQKTESGMILDKGFPKGGEIAVFNVSAGDNFDRQITIPVNGRNEKELAEAAHKELEKFHPDSFEHYELEYEGKRTPKYEKGGEMDCGCKFEDGGEILGKIPTFFGKGENLDVFGYQTKHFDNSVEASEFFKNIISEIESDRFIHIDIDKEFISNAAENLDRFFEIENKAIETQDIDENDIDQAVNSLLIAQSYVAMARIGKVINFVDNHVIALISFFDKDTLEVTKNPVEDFEPDSSQESIENLNEAFNEENDDSELADNDIYKEPKNSRNSKFPEWKSEIIENIMNKADVDKGKAIQLIEKWEKDNQRIFNIFNETIRDSNDMADAIIENGGLTYYKGGEIGFKEWESTVLSDVMDKGSMGKPRAIQAIDMYEDAFVSLKECYNEHEKSPEQVAQEIIDYTFDEIPDEKLDEEEFKRGGETKHIGFKKLAKKIAKTYREKGYSDKEAKAFGKDTAGKIRWVKENKAKQGGKIGFKNLAHKIEDEYEKEGFSKKRAKDIGIKTAAKVKREKDGKAVRGKHLTSKQKHYADKLMRHGTKEYIALARAKNKR